MRVRPFLALLAVAVALVTPSRASADGGADRIEVRIRGVCTGPSAAELRIRSEKGTMRIEFRIETTRRLARSWMLVVLRERRIEYRGVLRTAPRGRSVELRRSLPDWPGSEQVVVRAVAGGETCRASAVA